LNHQLTVASLSCWTEQQVRRPIGVTDWIQCSNPGCGKWRALNKPRDANAFAEQLRKGMGNRQEQVRCSQPLHSITSLYTISVFVLLPVLTFLPLGARCSCGTAG
jgi:hypothetical protein